MTVKIYLNTYEASGRLRSFNLHGQKIVVDEVIDHWNDGKYEYLQLLADDERIYLLKHRKGNHWEVQRIFSLHSVSQWG